MKFRWTISMKLVTMVIILVFAQVLLIGMLAVEAESSLKKEAANRLEIQKQQVDIQAGDYKNLIEAMHVFAGNNIKTNIEVARGQFQRMCGETVEKKGDHLVCPNGDVIDDQINDNAIVQSIKEIVRGHSSIFVDLGEGEAKKISTTETEGLYVYGYVAEPSLYEKVIEGDESFIKFTKVEGIYKTKACDPLKNVEGEVVGALCVGIKEQPTIDQIAEQVKNYSFGSGGIVYLVNNYETRVGEVMAHPVLETGTVLAEETQITEMLDQKEGVTEYQIESTPVVAAFDYFEPYDMLIVAEHPLIQEQIIGSQKIIFMSLVVLIISLVAALVFSRTITIPLKQLTEAGNKIAKAQLDVKIPDIRTNDEIKDLQTAMTAMYKAMSYLLDSINNKGKK